MEIKFDELKWNQKGKLWGKMARELWGIDFYNQLEGTHGDTLGFGRARKNMAYKKKQILTPRIPFCVRKKKYKDGNEKKEDKKTGKRE